MAQGYVSEYAPSESTKALQRMNKQLENHCKNQKGVFLNGNKRDSLLALSRFGGKPQNLVKSTGNHNAEIMVIGEGPGQLEEQKKRSFALMGPAGVLVRKVLPNSTMSGDHTFWKKKASELKNKKDLPASIKKILDLMGSRVEDYAYLTNVVKIRAKTQEDPPKDRAPTSYELASHMPYLQEEIRNVAPKLIICFGKCAYTVACNAACTGQFFNDTDYEDNPQLVEQHNTLGTLPQVELIQIPKKGSGAKMIRVKGVSDAIWVLGFPRPVDILRSRTKKETELFKATDINQISEEIFEVLRDINSGKIPTKLYDLITLEDIPRAAMEQSYEEHRIKSRDQLGDDIIKIAEKYSENGINISEDLSVSEVNERVKFSGVYEEDVTEHTWTDPKSVFYVRPDSQSRESIEKDPYYHIRLDDIEYCEKENYFNLLGRSEHGDSVLVQSFLSQEDSDDPAEQYKTFRFSGYTNVPQVFRRYLINKTRENKIKLVDAVCSEMQDPVGIIAQFKYDLEREEAMEQTEMIQGASTKLGEEEEEIDLADFANLLEETANQKNDAGAPLEEYQDPDYPKGFYEEFLPDDTEAIELLAVWRHLIFRKLVAACVLREDEYWKITLSYQKLKGNRRLHTRYDDVPVWIKMRFWNYTLQRTTKSMLKKMHMLNSQSKPFEFAEFLCNPAMQFHLYTGISAQSWFCFDPKKYDFKKIRENAPVKGWEREDMRQITSSDIYAVGSLDDLNPSIVDKFEKDESGADTDKLKDWSKMGSLHSLSWDIEMISNSNTKVPDYVCGAFVCAAFDLQINDKNTVIGAKGVCRQNVKYLFGLRKIEEPEVYYTGQGVAEDVKYPVEIKKFQFKREEDLLLAIAYFLHQVDFDVRVGHNSDDFDNVIHLLRSRVANIIFGYNVPALGRFPRNRNEVDITVFNSRAYQTQILKHITKIRGSWSQDTRRIAFRNVKLESYTLNAVAEAVLQDRKRDLNHIAIKTHFFGSSDLNTIMMLYCLHDAELPQQLMSQRCWHEGYTCLARITNCVFPGMFTTVGTQVCCNGSLMGMSFRPRGKNPDDPRLLNGRICVIQDFKDTFETSTTRLEDITEQEANTFWKSGDDAQTSETVKSWKSSGAKDSLKKFQKVLEQEEYADSLGLSECQESFGGSQMMKTIGTMLKQRDKTKDKERDYLDKFERAQDPKTANPPDIVRTPLEVSAVNVPDRPTAKKKKKKKTTQIYCPTDNSERTKEPNRVDVTISDVDRDGDVLMSEATQEDIETVGKISRTFLKQKRGDFTPRLDLDPKSPVKVVNFELPYDEATKHLSKAEKEFVLRPNIDSQTGQRTYQSVCIKKGGSSKRYVDYAKESAEKLKHKFKTEFLRELLKTYDGAVVFTPMVGFINVAVITLDFSSLYPSIMIYCNYSTETMAAKSEIAQRLISEEDFHKCCAKGVPGKYLNKVEVMGNKLRRDELSEELFSLKQYYMLTVYKGQPDISQYDPKTLLRICAENVDTIKKMETDYFDGEKYLQWFCARYGKTLDEIGSDFTLLNERTKEQDVIYLCTDDSMGQGIIPGNAVALIKERTKEKGELKKHAGTPRAKYHDAMQNGLKLIGNATYGYTAATGSNFGDGRISVNVTTQGRRDIEKGVKFVEDKFKDPNFPLNRGFTKEYIDEHTQLLGGDTDSCFFKYAFAEDVERATEFGLWQANYMRKEKLYDKPMTFAYEKVYQYAIFFAKKRYTAKKAESASTDSIFEKKAAIESFPELFPPERWSEFFSVREVDVLKFKPEDTEKIEKEKKSPDFISCELKKGKEIFYDISVNEKNERIYTPREIYYDYCEIKKNGGVAWWKPGVLKDANGTVYDKNRWGAFLGMYFSKLYSLDVEDFATFFQRPRYEGEGVYPQTIMSIHSRGIDTVRRSADKYTRETWKEVLKMIFYKGQYVEAGMYIRQRGKDLLEGNAPKHNLIFTANYGKEHYKNPVAHKVAIDRVVNDPNCGIPVPEIGSRFHYVIVAGTGKSSSRAYHPEMARKLGLVLDYGYYFKRFVKSLEGLVNILFPGKSHLLFEPMELTSRRDEHKRVGSVGKNAIVEVTKCVSCQVVLKGATDRVICHDCAAKTKKLGKQSPTMKQTFQDLNTYLETQDKYLSVCETCTGVKRPDCSNFECTNYEPRMQAQFQVQTQKNLLKSICRDMEDLCLDEISFRSETSQPTKRSKHI